MKREPDPSGPLTKAGKKVTLFLHADEYQALRQRSFDEHRSQASILREAVRKLLGIED